MPSSFLPPWYVSVLPLAQIQPYGVASSLPSRWQAVFCQSPAQLRPGQNTDAGQSPAVASYIAMSQFVPRLARRLWAGALSRNLDQRYFEQLSLTIFKYVTVM